MSQTKYIPPNNGYGYSKVANVDNRGNVTGGAIMGEAGGQHAYVASHLSGSVMDRAVLSIYDVNSSYKGLGVITLFDQNRPGIKIAEMTFHMNGGWRFTYTPSAYEELVICSEGDLPKREHLVIARKNDRGTYDCVVFSEGPKHNPFFMPCVCYDSRYNLEESEDLHPLAFARDLFREPAPMMSGYRPAELAFGPNWNSGNKKGRVMLSNPAGTHCLFYDMSLYGTQMLDDGAYQIGSCVDGKSVICASTYFAGIPKIGGSPLSFGCHVEENGTFYIGLASMTGKGGSIMPQYTFVTVDKNNIFVECNNPGVSSTSPQPIREVYDRKTKQFLWLYSDGVRKELRAPEFYDTWNIAPHYVRINRKSLNVDVMEKFGSTGERRVVSSYRYDDYFPSYEPYGWTRPKKDASLYCAGRVYDDEYSYDEPTSSSYYEPKTQSHTPSYTSTSQGNTTKVSSDTYSSSSQSTYVYTPPKKSYSEQCAEFSRSIESQMRPYNYSAYVDPNYVKVSSIKKPTEDVVIPDCVNELMARAFASTKCDVIKSISVPSSVTAIEKNCFCGCTNLTDVELDANISEIKEGVFANTAITYIVLPDSVKKIEKRAFENCPNLVAVYAAKDCTASKLAFPDGVQLYDKASFIPSSRGREMYRQAETKTSAQPVTAQKPTSTPKPVTTEKTTAAPKPTPATVPDIKADLADYSYRKLVSGYVITDVKHPKPVMTVPEGVVKLAGGAFMKAAGSLREVNLPTTLKEVGNQAFNGCKYLTTVHIENTQVETVGELAFCGTAIKRITMPRTIKVLKSGAFANCDVDKVFVPKGTLIYSMSTFKSGAIDTSHHK